MFLIGDIILIELDKIIGPGSDVTEGRADYLQHVIGCISVRSLRSETGLQQFDGLSSETRQPRV
jgi:hypothetical protein